MAENITPFEKVMQAIAMRESSGDPTKTSEKGAIGLLGIMPKDAMAGLRSNVPNVFDAATSLGFDFPDRSQETAEMLLRDPQINSMIGEKYFTELANKYNGDPEATLTAYNAGPGKYDRIGSAAGMDIAEQQDYAAAVARDYARLFGEPMPTNLATLQSLRPQSRPQRGLLQ